MNTNTIFCKCITLCVLFSVGSHYAMTRPGHAHFDNGHVRARIHVNAAKDMSPEEETLLRSRLQQTNMGFVENRGQLTDMEGRAVPFVLFRTETPQMDIYVTESGLTYLFKEMKEEKEEREEKGHRGPEGEREKIHMKSYRMDAQLRGAVIDKKRVEYLERNGSWHYNYFYGHCPDGIYDVKEYKKLRIRDVYPGINWVLQITEKGIKYDFEVSTEFVLGKNNEVSFRLLGYNPARPLLIDPQLTWATLYGGNDYDAFMSIVCDRQGNIFVTGETGSSNFPVQNAGTFFQGTGGLSDVIILKFDNSDNRLWATYYGGTKNERSASITADLSGNVFVTGYTNSTNFPVQNAGTFFQGTYAGGAAGYNYGDVFILKFDNSGHRLWATYYGGQEDDFGVSTTIDLSGNVFVAGYTGSFNFPVQNAGTFFQGTFSGGAVGWNYYDAFILKFDNSGNRLWATYYGGNDYDIIMSDDAGRIATDPCGNVYVSFDTESSNLFTLDPGNGSYFDGAFGGSREQFIARFSNTGVLQWATYWGGNGYGYMGSLAVSPVDSSLVFAGEWISYTSTASLPLVDPGGGAYYDDTHNGAGDSFVARFKNLPLTLDTASTASGCACDGSATVSVSGGAPPYHYSWQGSSGQDTAVYTALCPGTYTVTVTDANCNKDTAVVVVQGGGVGGLQLTTSKSDPSCGASNGSAGVTVTSGAAPYSYTWSSLAQSSTTATGLSAGNYTVTVTDQNSCTTSAVVTLQPSSAPQLTTSKTDPSCGASNGSAGVTTTGGASPYSYTWSGLAQSSATATGLNAGNYTVTVTDQNFCTASAVVTLQPSSAPQLTTSKVDPSCGASNGSAGVTTTGGAAPYSYTWSSLAQSSATATGLSSGNYTVTVTDQNNCTASASTTLQGTSGMACFTLAPEETNLYNPHVHLTDCSSGAVQWLWQFGDKDNSTSIVQHPVFSYQDTGTFCILLQVWDASGCTDTTQHCVLIRDEFSFYVPNAFTPNGDGKNDLFLPQGSGIKTYELYILDRWGNQLFHSVDLLKGWDGKVEGGKGEVSPEDVYVWMIEMTDSRNLHRHLTGSVTVIR